LLGRILTRAIAESAIFGLIGSPQNARGLPSLGFDKSLINQRLRSA
jgi:hypothetical protein